MLNMFKKSFWIPYEDSTVYPTMAKAMEEISRYCEERGETCVFTGDDEVEIEGKRYEIYRGYENGSRGSMTNLPQKPGFSGLLIFPPPPLQNND